MEQIFEFFIFCNMAAILRPFFGYFWHFGLKMILKWPPFCQKSKFSKSVAP